MTVASDVCEDDVEVQASGLPCSVTKGAAVTVLKGPQQATPFCCNRHRGQQSCNEFLRTLVPEEEQKRESERTMEYLAPCSLHTHSSAL